MPPIEASPGVGPRRNGLFILALVVGVGLLASAGWFRLKGREAIETTRRVLAEAPDTTEGRLQQWMLFGAPRIDQQLSLARFSSQLPWLVTHTVEAEDGGDPVVFGIELGALGPEAVVQAGLVVRVELPAPQRLGRLLLEGDNARHIPHFAVGEAPADAEPRARELVAFFLKDLPENLSRDIPGARIEVWIGGRGPESGSGVVPGAQEG